MIEMPPMVPNAEERAKGCETEPEAGPWVHVCRPRMVNHLEAAYRDGWLAAQARIAELEQEHDDARDDHLRIAELEAEIARLRWHSAALTEWTNRVLAAEVSLKAASAEGERAGIERCITWMQTHAIFNTSSKDLYEHLRALAASQEEKAMRAARIRECVGRAICRQLFGDWNESYRGSSLSVERGLECPDVRDDELFNVLNDARWEREIKRAIRAKVPIADFLKIYDAAHAVIDHIRLHVDHAEYEGSMNAVNDFREIAAKLLWKHAKKVPDPLTSDIEEDD